MYDILSIPCVLTNVINKVQQCKVLEQCKKIFKKYLEFILNEVEKDVDKSYVYHT